MIVIRGRQQIVPMDKLHIIFLGFVNTVLLDITVIQNVIKFVSVLILQIVMMVFMELVLVNSVKTTQPNMGHTVRHVLARMEIVMVVFQGLVFVNHVIYPSQT
jgi:hypothetical protein